MNTIEDFVSEVFNEYGIPLFENGSPFKKMQDEAYTNLAALRAQAAAAETLRGERDELRAKANISVCSYCSQECPKEPTAMAEHIISCDKRPEKKLAEEILSLSATVAAQAREIEAARESFRRIAFEDNDEWHDQSMDEERERLSNLKSERILQLEGALKSVLSHFGISSVAWSVIYDNRLTVEELRSLVIITGDVPGFPEKAPNWRMMRDMPKENNDERNY